MKEATLDIKSDLRELFRVRSFIREFCEETEDPLLDEDRIADMELVSTEVVTNIIKYSYRYSKNKLISLKAKAFKDKIIFSFYDWGRNGFCPPKNISKPTPGQIGRYGLYIIECMVDDVTYFRDKKGKNCCCLVIRRAVDG